MKISHKLILSFLLVATLASVSTLFTVWSYAAIDHSFEKLVQGPTQMVETLNKIKYTGLQIGQITDRAVHRYNGPAVSADDETERTAGVFGELRVNLDAYANLVPAADHEESLNVLEIRAAGENLIEASRELLDQTKRSTRDDQLIISINKLDASQRAFSNLIDTAHAFRTERQTSQQANIRVQLSDAARRAVIVRILAYLLSILAGLYLSFVISRRIRRLKEATQRLGSGQPNTLIENDSKDEIGDLSRSISKMVGDLTRSGHELAAAKNFTEKILESMVDFVLVTDLDMNITRVNRSTTELNGYTEDELIGQPANMLMADRPFNKKGVDMLRANGFAPNIEKLNRSKDGSITPISMSVSVFKDDEGNDLGLVCVGKDISRRKAIEAEMQDLNTQLEAQKQRLDDTLQNAPCVIWETSLNAANQPAGTGFVSGHVTEMYGYTPEEWMSTPDFWRSAVHPEDLDEVLKQHEKLFAVGHASSRCRWITKDGRVIWGDTRIEVVKDSTGTPVSLRGVTTDITEHNRNELERQAIAEIVQGAIKTPGISELFDIAYRSINRCISAENCYIALYDPAKDLMTYEFWEDKRRPVPAPHPIEKNFGSYVMRTSRSLLLTEEIKRRIGETGEVDSTRPYSPSWMGAPLRIGSKTIGILVVQDYDKADAYGERDLEMLGVIGDQLALAIERRRAEEALRISDEHHRLLFESNPQPAFVYDLETLAFLTVNEAAIQQYGYSREEFFADMTVEDIHPASNIPDFLERVTKVSAANDVILAPSKHRKKNGKIMDVEITSHALVFSGRNAEIVLVNDITARRRQEAESEVISEVIRGVVTTSTLEELLALVHRCIGGMLYAENCYVALYDSRTDLLSVPFCIDEFDTVASPARLGRGLTAYVLRMGTPTLLNQEGIHRLADDGSVDIVGTLPAIWLGVPLRTREGVIGVLVVQHYSDSEAYDESHLRFLTTVGDQIGIAIERKQAEERLQVSEEGFKDLFDNAPIAYHELDIDGRYTRINRTEEMLLGYTNDELRGRHPSEIIVEKDSRVVTNAKISGDMPLEPVERTFIRKDGTYISVLNQDRLIRDEDGRTIGIRSTLQDITARKHAEEQLKVFNEKLQQSNRELQDFAYVASHDLQEPLRKVQAFSDRLNTKYAAELEGDGLDYLERMRSAANRMQMLIQDLLTFSRVSTKALPFTAVDLKIIISEVLTDLEIKIEETAATIEYADMPTIEADPMQMRQLMQNLIGNALKFKSQGVAPVIKIVADRVAWDGNGNPAHVRIRVEDNGIGFDQKYTDKIFTVFQRLHGRTEYEGSGVGLAICRKIVERHDGTITAKSNPGEGATFVFTLPLKQKTSEVN